MQTAFEMAAASLRVHACVCDGCPQARMCNRRRSHRSCDARRRTSACLLVAQASSIDSPAGSYAAEADRKKVVVVGAGWAGFGAAKQLAEQGALARVECSRYWLLSHYNLSRLISLVHGLHKFGHSLWHMQLCQRVPVVYLPRAWKVAA
jgi:hypothetical protein